MQLNVLSRFLSKQAKESNGNASNTTTKQLEVRNTSCYIAVGEAVILVYSSAVIICRLDLCTSYQTQEHIKRTVNYLGKMKICMISYFCVYKFALLFSRLLYGQYFGENNEGCRAKLTKMKTSFHSYARLFPHILTLLKALLLMTVGKKEDIYTSSESYRKKRLHDGRPN